MRTHWRRNIDPLVSSAVPISRRTVIGGSLLAFGPSRAETGSVDPADLDRMIGSMVIMGFRGSSSGSEGARAVAADLSSRQIGGVILFEDNVESPAAARNLISSFRTAGEGVRPFISVDQEGGVVSRLRPENGFKPLPSARAVGLMSDAEAVELYTATARELRELGFNLNFAPVVDLDVNPKNPIIGALGRSFSSDPDRVVKSAKIFIDAHRRSHILTALKHFPGHGSTVEDSHVSLPDTSATWSREELKPFVALITSGYADMIMVGHLMNGALTEPGRPASLSTRAVHGLLRKDLGFDGVVVSDDMQMGALRRSYPPDEAILLAVKAGVDLFVFSNREHPDPDMPARFYRVVKTAIADGQVSPYRIVQSAQRIANLKKSFL